MSDESIIQGLRKGDAEALEQAVRRYQNLVYSICLHALYEPNAAEDAAQVVFLTLWKKGTKLSSGTVLVRWLYWMAGLVCRQYRRSGATRRKYEARAAMVQNPVRSEASAQIDQDEMRRELYAALDGLSGRQRDVVILTYLQNNTREEVAKTLGIPEGTVASRLSAAMEKMRARLVRRGMALSLPAITAFLSKQLLTTATPNILLGVQAGAAGVAAGAAVGGAGMNAGAATLLEGTAKALFWIKVKVIASAVAASTVVIGGATVGIQQIVQASSAKSAGQSESTSAEVVTNSVTRHGITWHFDGSHRVGRFVNGDYYVVGPVRVVSVDPMPRDGMNGSMKNPDSPDAHGFHALIRGYDPKRSLVFPVDLTPGDALVSTVGVSAGDVVARPWGDTVTGPAILAASVLTCLAVSPPSDAFRPPFAGPERPIYRASRLRRDLLLKLPLPTRKMERLDWSDAERKFERPWFGYSSRTTLRMLRPAENMLLDDRTLSHTSGDATLMLCLDVPESRKETLLRNVVQTGIDQYGWQWLRTTDGRSSGEMVSSGRKWLILFAGMMLDDENMKHPKARFAEDVQTYYGRGARGESVLWRITEGKGHEERSIDAWRADSEDVWEESHRRYISWAWSSQALVARLLKAEPLWNHPAFFDYVDRWMFVKEKPEQVVAVQELILGLTPQGANIYQQAARGSAFRFVLWDSYRSLGASPSDKAGEDVLRAWAAYQQTKG